MIALAEGGYECIDRVILCKVDCFSLRLHTAPPLFVNSSVLLTVFVDLPATLPCHVLPDPLLSFIWLFEGETLDVSTGSGLELLANGSLVIASVSTNQEGTFTCVASNSLGSALGFVMVTVLGKLVPCLKLAMAFILTLLASFPGLSPAPLEKRGTFILFPYSSHCCNC